MQTFNVGDKECVALVRKLTPRECFRLFEQSRRVYGINALAPAMHTVGGDNLEPKIMIIYDTDKTMP